MRKRAWGRGAPRKNCRPVVGKDDLRSITTNWFLPVVVSTALFISDCSIKTYAASTTCLDEASVATWPVTPIGSAMPLLLLSDDGVFVCIDKLRRLLEADEVALCPIFHSSGDDSELC